MLALCAVLALPPLAARADGAATDVQARAAAMVADLGLVAAPRPAREDPRWRPPARIVVRAESPAILAALAPLAPGVELVPARDAAAARAAIPGADALIGFCDHDILAAADRLRWVQLFSAGSEGCVGAPAVREGRVILTNMQRISSPEIAEHVLALLLGLTRGLHVYGPAQQAGRWDDEALPRERTWELGGRTLLVVGLGGIGSQVARRAKALGMRVVATRASGGPPPPGVDRVAPPGELLALAAGADAVVNTAPLTPDTTGLFDAKFFAAMKPTAFFINVGRGRSVVTADLVDALRAGRIAAAGLDVVEPEPLPPGHPLWTLPNVIITPHVAAGSDKVFGRVLLMAQENLRRWVAGEPLLSVVDPARGY